MSRPQDRNLFAARDHLLSLTIELAKLVDRREKLVSEIQQLKKTQGTPSELSSFPAWSPQREHDVFRALFEQLPELSDSTLNILSWMIENQVQLAQGEKSYPQFSRGEHLLSENTSAETRPSLKINPILALYYRPQLYRDHLLQAWARVAVFQSPKNHS